LRKHMTPQELEPPTATKFASNMVRQSLMELKEKLGAARREKGDMDH